MNHLSRFLATQMVTRLPKNSGAYRKALRSSYARTVTLSREIERLLNEFDKEIYLQEMLESRLDNG
jgi:hypothetical protein